MEQGLILLVAAALMVYVAPGVQGTAHLSFSNNTAVNVTRDGCGVAKLCVETPNDCDPSANDSCLFMSADAGTPMAPNGTNLNMQLRGSSQGYVAVGLTMDATQGSAALFVCAQNSSNNGSFFFRTMQRNNTNGALTPVETRVREIRGMVQGNIITCEFEIPNANATAMRATDMSTTFQVLLGTGPLNGNMLGDFNVTLTSASLNLANPVSTMTTAAPTTAAPTTAAPTTAAPTNTTSGYSGGAHSHAVLTLLSALSPLVMLRA